MKNKNSITTQLSSYEKAYKETKNFDEFKVNICNIIVDIESITPITPAYSSHLFDLKLDCENLDRFGVDNMLLSIKAFLEKLD